MPMLLMVTSLWPWKNIIRTVSLTVALVVVMASMNTAKTRLIRLFRRVENVMKPTPIDSRTSLTDTRTMTMPPWPMKTLNMLAMNRTVFMIRQRASLTTAPLSWLAAWRSALGGGLEFSF